MKKTIVLKLSIEQAAAVQQATELLMRLGLGQFDYVADLMDLGKITKKNSTPIDWVAISDCRDRLKSISQISGCCDLGIGNKNLHKDIPRSYEIHNLLAKALSSIEATKGAECRAKLSWRPCGDEPAPVVSLID